MYEPAERGRPENKPGEPDDPKQKSETAPNAE